MKKVKQAFVTTMESSLKQEHLTTDRESLNQLLSCLDLEQGPFFAESCCLHRTFHSWSNWSIQSIDIHAFDNGDELLQAVIRLFPDSHVHGWSNITASSS